MKQKMFFLHSAGSMGLSVWKGFGSHGVSEFFCFFFCHPPLPILPRPPTLDVFFGQLWLLLYLVSVS